MKRFFMVAILCLSILTGCGGTKEIRDTTAGEVITITLDEMQEKIERGDTFTLALTTTMCSYCQKFHQMLDTYLPTHHVVIYEVVLDEETTSANENRKRINQTFPTFDSTPGIFYVEAGKEKDNLKNRNDGINETYFDEWVIKNKLDIKTR